MYDESPHIISPNQEYQEIGGWSHTVLEGHIIYDSDVIIYLSTARRDVKWVMGIH